MTKTLTAAQEKKKLSEKHVGIFPLEFDDNAGEAEVSIPDVIHLIPIGQWEHDLYGPILITAGDIREFAQNFNAGIRKGVPITAGHEGMAELPANGWITSVECRDTGLWGVVEWNELGKETLSDKQYKFFSPEFYRDYEDPQTHQLYRNVITGGALTKSPYFKELEAIVFSEKKLQKQFNDNQNTMDLATLLAKDITTLDEAEKAFIKEHKAELTAEQLVSHTAIVDDAETAEEKEKREGDENEAKGLNRDGSAKAEKTAEEIAAENVAAGLNPDGSVKVEGSDRSGKMIQMSETEHALLVKKADEGAQAFAELEKGKLNASVAALTFSESNKTGKFLPKSTDKLRTFMQGLNAEQKLAFSVLIADLPKNQVFNEVGASGAAEGTATAEVEAKVAVKMTAAEKAGTPMKYSEALKEVMSEEKGLEERYDASLPSARKVQA